MTACQTLPKITQLPPLSETVVLQIGEVGADQKVSRNSLLFLEPMQAQEWRFVQVDALGSPLARQILRYGHWSNDGFLPPNTEASLLFTAVYAYILYKNHMPLPDNLKEIQFISNTDGSTQVQWHQHNWRLQEAQDNE